MTAAMDHLRPGDSRALSTAEFASTAGLTEHDVQELRDYQLLPAGPLDLRTALALREAVRLRADFDLDLFATGLLAGYIRRVHDLEEELRHHRAHSREQATTVYTEVSFTSIRVAGR
jgi:hypothetical protein